MVEVLWVSLFGAVLAWLQSQSDLEREPEVEVEVEVEEITVPVEDGEWSRWEEEIHDWRDQ
ncbi:hypothetical protein BH23ACT9_BH23ACT9_32890 [soil metagenome]